MRRDLPGRWAGRPTYTGTVGAAGLLWHCCLLLVVVCLGMLAAPACAQQDPPPPAIPFDGPDVFCYLLKSRKFTPIRSVEALKDHDADDTLVVIFGVPGVPELAAFRDGGGNVLIASDNQGAELDDWTVAGKRITQHSAKAYRRNSECPSIGTLEQARPAGLPQLTKPLATNRPSFLQPAQRNDLNHPLQRQGISIVARFDGTCAPAGSNAKGRPRIDMLPYIIAYSEHDKRLGRALLVAGQGQFANGMLLQTDSDNFAFAVHCLDWLGKSPDGRRRTHALFVVDGRVIDSFDVSLNPPPLPIPPLPTIALVNRLLQGMEQERIPLHILKSTGDVRTAVRIAIMALTLGLVCYGAKKLTEGRHYSEKGSVLLSGPYAAAPDIAPLVEQRARAQIERNALGAEARALVRTWFLEVCAVPVVEWDRTPARPAPTAVVTGGWWERYRLRRQLEQLARLAGPAMPASFSWVEMVRLTKALQALSVAMQQGRLRFAGCSPDENS